MRKLEIRRSTVVNKQDTENCSEEQFRKPLHLCRSWYSPRVGRKAEEYVRIHGHTPHQWMARVDWCDAIYRCGPFDNGYRLSSSKPAVVDLYLQERGENCRADLVSNANQ